MPGSLRRWCWKRPTAGIGRRTAGRAGRLGSPGASVGGEGVRVSAGEERFRDAADLADLLRMGRLPEAWIAPPATRELRELVRHRAKLVHARTSLRARSTRCWPVRVCSAGERPVRGRGAASCCGSWSCRSRVSVSDRLAAAADRGVRPGDRPGRTARGAAAHDPGFVAVQTIPGVGRSWGRCSSPRSVTCTVPWPGQLASWAGLTPKHHESDTTVHRGRITKQGSRLVRWAAVEAVQRILTAPGWRRSGTGSRPARPQHRHGRCGAGATRVGLLRVTGSPRPPAETSRPWRRDLTRGFTIGAGRDGHDPRPGVVAPAD